MSGDRQEGRIHPVLSVLLAIVAFFLLMGMMKSCVEGVLSTLTGSNGTAWPLGWGWPGHSLLPLGVWGFVQIILAVWVGFDAQKRGMHGALWGLLVFFTGIIGLIVYLIVHPTLAAKNGGSSAAQPAAAPRCGKCGAAVQPEFKACPYCGAPMRCPHCDQAIQAGWKVCPHCAEPL